MSIVKRCAGFGVALGFICLWAPSGGWAGSLSATAPQRTTVAQAGPEVRPSPLPWKTEPSVSYENGLLTVKAERSDLVKVLEQIAAATGIGFVKSDMLNILVTVSFEKQPLAPGVEAVLKASGSRRYATVYEKHDGQLRLVKVVLVNKGARDISTTSWPEGVGRGEADMEKYFKKLLGTDVWVKRNEQLRLPSSIKFYDPGASQRITRENIREYAEELFKKVGPLFALDFSQLKFRAVVERNDLIQFGYDQVFQGVPVKGGGFGLSVYTKASGALQQPDMISIGSRFYPDIDLSPTPTVDKESATLIAKREYEKNWKSVYPGRKSYSEVPEDDKSLKSGFELLILPVEPKISVPGQIMGYDYHLCWKFQFGKMIYFVDAHQGVVVQQENTVVYEISGLARTKIFGQEVSGTETEAFVDNGVVAIDSSENPVLKSLAGIQVTLNGGQPVWTGLDGSFAFPATSDPNNPGEVRSFLNTAGAEDIGPWLKEHHENSPELVSMTKSDQAPNQEYEAAEGNAFYQVVRGIGVKGLLRPDIGGPDLRQKNIRLRQGYLQIPDTKPGTLGACSPEGDGYLIRLTENGKKYSDVILHELSHAAVIVKHGTFLTKPNREAVSEGLADYFACRINNDPTYHPHGTSYDLDGDPELQPKDEDGDKDGTLTELDWAYYHNGKVIAAILWDVTKTQEGKHKDDKLWWSIDSSNIDHPIQGTTPEHLYDALDDNDVNADRLWQAFSAHHVNLFVLPGRRIEDGTPLQVEGPAITLDWFVYRGFLLGSRDYIVRRKKLVPNGDPVVDEIRLSGQGTWDPATNSSLWIDSDVEAGVKYTYSIIPCDANGNHLAGGKYSNEMMMTAPDGVRPVAPNITLSRSPSTGPSDGGVYVEWSTVPTTRWELEMKKPGVEEVEKLQFAAYSTFSHDFKFLSNRRHEFQIFAVGIGGLRSAAALTPLSSDDTTPTSYRWIEPLNNIAPAGIQNVSSCAPIIKDGNVRRICLDWDPKTSDDA